MLTYHSLLLIPAVFLGWATLSTLAGQAVLAAERGQPVSYSKRDLAVLARESAARVLLGALRPLGIGQPDPAPSGAAVGTARLPVLLVGGPGLNRTAWTFLRLFLVRRGYGWIHAVSVSASPDGLAGQAEQIAKHVASLRATSGAPQVDVVAHGEGGLAVAWYLRHQQGSAHTRRLITLGTPWSGTRMAVFDRSANVVELLPGSPALDELQPPPVPTVAVWSEDDPHVVPSRSAVPLGADSVQLDAAGHRELLLSARAFRAVLAALEPAPGQGAV